MSRADPFPTRETVEKVFGFRGLKKSRPLYSSVSVHRFPAGLAERNV